MNSKRAEGVISINDVAKLLKENAKFHCRYDYYDLGRSNSPRYTCTYILEDGAEEALISVRYAGGGVNKRLFSLWPGLYKHHREYGDGSELVVHEDDTISTIKVDGKGRIKAITGPLASAQNNTDPGS
ncbi:MULTISPECIES: hypothetical protein [unclassified Leisingera]|uniref:hypothetical protein n=1 Tax=unclassified Leisingera TaxID=2614906 RepID=UPI0013E93624|nr:MULTISPECIES: hypothetical protein [unclassified Leisingera]MCF6433161.1 hypothetical protein [Leisingera sp. MMG026]UWQ77475.1 hypothetical protein K3724_23355 [Leisingera sp. M658]